MAVVCGVFRQAPLGTAAGPRSHLEARVGKGHIQAVLGRCHQPVLGPSTRVFCWRLLTPRSKQRPPPLPAKQESPSPRERPARRVLQSHVGHSHVVMSVLSPPRLCGLEPVAGRCRRAQGRAGRRGPRGHLTGCLPREPSACFSARSRFGGYWAPCPVKGGGAGSRTGSGPRAPESAWGCPATQLPSGGLALVQNLLVRRRSVFPGLPHAAGTSQL